MTIVRWCWHWMTMRRCTNNWPDWAAGYSVAVLPPSGRSFGIEGKSKDLSTMSICRRRQLVSSDISEVMLLLITCSSFLILYKSSELCHCRNKVIGNVWASCVSCYEKGKMWSGSIELWKRTLCKTSRQNRRNVWASLVTSDRTRTVLCMTGPISAR